MQKNLFYLLAISAVALSLATHSIVFSEFVMPTYGNTMIHVATARHLVEHGEYPFEDYSYGGGIANTYVPLYRVSFAAGKVLTGLDYDTVGRLLVRLFAVMVPIGFLLAGRELFGDWAGLAAGFLVTTMPEYLIYTVRPLPQAMGLALLPFFVYAIAANKKTAAVLLAIGIALTHQEAGAFLAASAFAFFCLDVARHYFEKKKFGFSSEAGISFASWFAATVSYFAWHFFTAGNLHILGLAQFVNHEGAVVTLDFLYSKTGLLVLALSLIGLLLLFLKFSPTLRKKFFPQQSKISANDTLVLAWLAVGLFAIKNDLFGLAVFMDRFVVYLQIPLVLLAAFALAEAGQLIWDAKWPKWR